jgi:hypothetical protein
MLSKLILKKYLPQFNTDASGNVKPMLAKAVDWKKVQYPCYIQPKLDGVRCLMIVASTRTAHGVYNSCPVVVRSTQHLII